MVEGESANDNLIDRKSGAIKLQIVPAQPKTLSHLPTRPAVDLAFHDLVYTVREGRRNRKYFFFICRYMYFLYFSMSLTGAHASHWKFIVARFPIVLVNKIPLT